MYIYIYINIFLSYAHQKALSFSPPTALRFFRLETRRTLGAEQRDDLHLQLHGHRPLGQCRGNGSPLDGSEFSGSGVRGAPYLVWVCLKMVENPEKPNG